MKTTILVLLVIISLFLLNSCTRESNVTDSTQTINTKESDQPLCVNYNVFENGREVTYMFSCSYHVINETQDSKWISFFYEDGSLAYSFDLQYVMNDSRVHYAPDCDK